MQNRPIKLDLSAALLKASLKEYMAEHPNAPQAFAIRIHRAISWLDRSQAIDPADLEGRFISTWIGFNALYGRLEESDKPTGDRSSWNDFLVRLHGLDANRRIAQILVDGQDKILPLIGSKYLFGPFWQEGKSACKRLEHIAKKAIHQIDRGDVLPVLIELFERIYTLRLQVFHGASTKGSRLNRRNMERAVGVMAALLPAFVYIVLVQGAGEDWGDVCFPPVE